MGAADDGLLLLCGIDLGGLQFRVGGWRRRRLPMEEGGGIVQSDVLPGGCAVSCHKAESGLIENRRCLDAEARLRFGLLLHGKFFDGGVRSGAPMDDRFGRNVALQNGRDGKLCASLNTRVLRLKADDARLRVGEQVTARTEDALQRDGHPFGSRNHGNHNGEQHGGQGGGQPFQWTFGIQFRRLDRGGIDIRVRQ